MKYKDHIFDIGAYNGLDGIALALKNKDVMIHAFEANPELIKIIKENKKKIEKFLNISIKNYKILNLAVSDRRKLFQFNIAKNPTVSSLNKFSKNLEKTWPGYREAHCTIIKKVKVKGITLNEYCTKNHIFKINYLHIDTQGNDLKVLQGLKKKIDIVERGVLEAAINKKNALYTNNHTVKDVKKFFNKKKFEIDKILSVNIDNSNEKNIFFYKKNINFKKDLNLNYNLRYFNRIITNKVNLKDKIFCYLDKLFLSKYI